MKTQIIIIFLTLGMVACKKSDVATPGVANVATGHNLNAVEINPANPANPYDSFGYLHNLILSEMQPCIKTFGVATGQQVTGCLIPIAGNERLDESGTPFNLVPIVVNDSQYDFKHVISNSDYSLHSKLVMDSLVRLVKNVAVKTDADYPQIKSAIMVFESSVSDDRTLSIEEKATLLEMTSVARYSIFYWFQPTQKQGLSLKRIIMTIGTAMTDAVSLVVYKSVGFAVDSSEEAWLDMTWEIPGSM